MYFIVLYDFRKTVREGEEFDITTMMSAEINFPIITTFAAYFSKYGKRQGRKTTYRNIWPKE